MIRLWSMSNALVSEAKSKSRLNLKGIVPIPYSFHIPPGMSALLSRYKMAAKADNGPSRQCLWFHQAVSFRSFPEAVLHWEMITDTIKTAERETIELYSLLTHGRSTKPGKKWQNNQSQVKVSDRHASEMLRVRYEARWIIRPKLSCTHEVIETCSVESRRRFWCNFKDTLQSFAFRKVWNVNREQKTTLTTKCMYNFVFVCGTDSRSASPVCYESSRRQTGSIKAIHTQEKAYWTWSRPKTQKSARRR